MSPGINPRLYKTKPGSLITQGLSGLNNANIDIL